MREQSSAKPGLSFEDLHVGQIFRSPSLEVTVEEIVSFASRYDPQPFHTDAIAAKASIFGGLVSSALLTGAVTVRLTLMGEMVFAKGTIGLGIESIDWPKPVRPSDILTVRNEILATRPSQSKPGYGVVKVRTTTLNQNGEVVQVKVSNQLIARKSA